MNVTYRIHLPKLRRVMTNVGVTALVLIVTLGATSFVVKNMKKSSMLTLAHSRYKHAVTPPTLPDGFRLNASELKTNIRLKSPPMKVGNSPYPTPGRQYFMISR